MKNKDTPLAIKMRPKNLDDFIGQEHILGEGKLLRRIIESQKFVPMIFYGPPGCGKTTLGFIIASGVEAEVKYLNAAFTNVKEVKEILNQARDNYNNKNKKTLVFVDEIHRFNKLQQETLVPDTEAGTIIFIGATVHNPRYYLIRSLISRSVLAEFKSLSNDGMQLLIANALRNKDNGLGGLNIKITDEASDYLILHSSGDGRKALTSLDLGAQTTAKNSKGEIVFDLAVAQESIQKNIFYDKKDDYHYDTISAFIKSIRGSDPDSALYWLAKMITAGEDPRFIARRLTILASEDIGNANPFSLILATNCFKAVEFIGMPEGRLILAHTTIYLACSPKSNACYKAYEAAAADIIKNDIKDVPKNVKPNSKDYQYPHDHNVGLEGVGGYVDQNYGTNATYYCPTNIGQEKRIKEFLEQIKKFKVSKS